MIFGSATGHLITFLILSPFQASLTPKLNVERSDQASFLQMPSFNESNPILNDVGLSKFFGKKKKKKKRKRCYHGLQLSGSGTTLPIAQHRMHFYNTNVHTDCSNLIDVPSNFAKILISPLQIGDNQTSYLDLALMGLSLGGNQLAPWTTLKYAFRPLYLKESINGVEGYPQNINWTVTAIGVWIGELPQR